MRSLGKRLASPALPRARAGLKPAPTGCVGDADFRYGCRVQRCLVGMLKAVEDGVPTGFTAERG